MYLSFNNNTIFDYNYNREITDTTENVSTCKIFITSLLKGNFDGFENKVTVDMQKGLFNKDAIGQLTGGWNYITSQSGNYKSYSICEKNRKLIMLLILLLIILKNQRSSRLLLLMTKK